MTAVTEETFAGLEVEDAPEFTVPDPNGSRRSRREYLFSSKDKAESGPKARPAKRRKPAPRAKKGAFVEPLEQLYTTIGMMLMAFDPTCAEVVIKSANQCAEAMDELAYQNEAVRRALVALTTTSAVGAVLFAHAPIIMAVAMHHGPGKMTDTMMGMFTKERPQDTVADDND